MFDGVKHTSILSLVSLFTQRPLQLSSGPGGARHIISLFLLSDPHHGTPTPLKHHKAKRDHWNHRAVPHPKPAFTHPADTDCTITTKRPPPALKTKKPERLTAPIALTMSLPSNLNYPSPFPATLSFISRAHCQSSLQAPHPRCSTPLLPSHPPLPPLAHPLSPFFPPLRCQLFSLSHTTPPSDIYSSPLLTPDSSQSIIIARRNI